MASAPKSRLAGSCQTSQHRVRVGDPAVASRKLRVLQTIGDAARTTGLVGGQAIDLQAAGLAPGRAIGTVPWKGSPDACASR